ncbi:DUF1788 domain-containing protein [Verrucomicrobia bacterium]|nr:DUF1788 domain-containing protein [Verrucomicrobiota bacterium]
MNWKERLKMELEPVLAAPDPRPKLGAYHDMPYAIFYYAPESEFDLREEVKLLTTRLENAGKRVTKVSLSECLMEALDSQGMDAEALRDDETMTGVQSVIETVHNILSDDDFRPLIDLVTERLPETQDPLKDIVLLVRAGSLFPVYRTHALLEQLKGRLRVPSVLFYPGELEGPTGLSFMGIYDPDPNYRPKIF